MEDKNIIDLYNLRDESAIAETKIKYGRILYRIALNILSNNWDSEEIVNDTYAKVWNAIPPANPTSLGAYLGKITRNLSINRFTRDRAKKRYNGGEILLSELGDCIPSPSSLEDEIDIKDLTRIINSWLASLTLDNRILFLKRYWFGQPVKSLAKEAGLSPNKLTSRLYRLRQSLKKALEKEDVFL